MDLTELGWDTYQQKLSRALTLDEEEVGRVAIEHKTGHILFTSQGELEGVLPAATRHKATSTNSLPKVGDWVTFTKVPGEAKAKITTVLPRISTLSRIGVGRNLEEQITATNIDRVFIVQGLDENFNLARFERLLLMVRNSGAQPILVLNKTDLSSNIETFVKPVEQLAPGVPIVLVSAKQGNGIENIREHINPGMTIVFLGVSGVGKSTLINTLLEKQQQATKTVRTVDSRGRHTTTRREMIVLPGGGVLIDTPGIRELQLDANEEALQDTFSDILTLSTQCKFRDCDHEKSAGCKVLAAIQADTLKLDRYKRFLKLTREQKAQGRRHVIQGSKERKGKAKIISKTIHKTTKYKRGGKNVW